VLQGLQQGENSIKERRENEKDGNEKTPIKRGCDLSIENEGVWWFGGPEIIKRWG